MAQAATETMLKLAVLGLVVLSAQVNGQYFRRLRFRDYEPKSDPSSTGGLRSAELPDVRTRILDRADASPETNLRNPVSRAFLVRESTAKPPLGNMPLFPNFIQTVFTQGSDGELEQTNFVSGANPFGSLLTAPNVIIISSVDGSQLPPRGALPEVERSPVPENSPAEESSAGAGSVPPSGGPRNFRFENFLHY